MLICCKAFSKHCEQKHTHTHNRARAERTMGKWGIEKKQKDEYHQSPSLAYSSGWFPFSSMQFNILHLRQIPFILGSRRLMPWLFTCFFLLFLVFVSVSALVSISWNSLKITEPTATLFPFVQLIVDYNLLMQQLEYAHKTTMRIFLCGNNGFGNPRNCCLRMKSVFISKE